MKTKKILIEGYAYTASGILFNLMDPDERQITIDDIATGLTNNCRWNGQVRRFYSVAEHSLRCWWMYKGEAGKTIKPQFPWQLHYEKNVGLALLLHDSEEAYWGDTIRPIKSLLPARLTVKMAELRYTIMRKYGVTEDYQEIIDHYDNLMLEWEFENVVTHENYLHVKSMLPDENTKKMFLDAFFLLSS